MTSHDRPVPPSDRTDATATSDAAGHEDREAVLRAADRLVRAFATGDLDGYFASFAPDASFVFHSHPERLDSTAAYRAVWATWVAEDGFRVIEAASHDPQVQFLGEDVAVFTHRVRTVIATHGGSDTLHERETIVFAREGAGRWLAVHEHLSAAPTSSDAADDGATAGTAVAGVGDAPPETASGAGADADRGSAAARG